MKRKLLLVIVILLLIILTYMSNIANIPNSIILLEGESINIRTLFGVQTLCVSGDTAESDNNKMRVEINLLGNIPLKNVDVSIIPDTKVIPIGKVIGLKLYTNGVLVVGMGDINGVKPYVNSGIKEGDTIVEINNVEIDSIQRLKEVVNYSNGENVEIKYVRDGSISTANVIPAKSEDEYKLGLWVRDAATGVGTMTFYVPKTNQFAALGHGIIDVDTDELINIESGEIVNSKIISIKKAEERKSRRNQRYNYKSTRNRCC